MKKQLVFKKPTLAPLTDADLGRVSGGKKAITDDGEGIVGNPDGGGEVAKKAAP